MVRKRKNRTGSLVKRGNSWYIRISINGKIIQRTIREPDTGKPVESKGRAEYLAPKLIAHLTNHIAKETYDPYSIQIKDLDNSYCVAFPNHLNYMSAINRQTNMNRFIDRFPTLADITHESLGRYVSERLATPTRNGKKRSPANVNRELSFLRTLLNWAENLGKIERNPIRGYQFLKEPEGRDRILTQEEIDRLTETIQKVQFYPIRLIVLISLYCGLRSKEVRTLEWDAIDWEREEFDIINSKGKKRRIPIPKSIQEELKRWPHESDTYVFPSTKVPNKPIGSIKRSFATLLKDAEIEQFWFHDLRHTTASWMLRKGADVRTVQEILGHANITTTMRYLTSLADQKQKAVEWGND